MSGNNPASDFADRLRQYGIFPTGQRLAIAQALLIRHQHVTADQLFGMLRENGEKVSKATVYNTLNLFADKGLIREILVDPAHVYFDSNNTPHHHFYNVDEGVLFDSGSPLCELLPSIRLPQGTVLDEVNVVIKIRNCT